MRPILVALVALVLAGCATTQQEPVQPVDTFCLSSKKIRWSTADSAETVRQVEVHNRTIDARCGIPGK